MQESLTLAQHRQSIAGQVEAITLGVFIDEEVSNQGLDGSATGIAGLAFAVAEHCHGRIGVSCSSRQTEMGTMKYSKISNTTDDYSDMSFKVDAAFHYRYKIAAITTGKTMKKVMQESFELWLRVHDIKI